LQIATAGAHDQRADLITLLVYDLTIRILVFYVNEVFIAKCGVMC
jgi:hypothetical protein